MRQGATISPAGADREHDLAAVRPGYDLAAVRERFRRLREELDGTWLLVEQDGETLGWCVAVWSGKPSHPEYPDMQDLYVRREHRGCGHGTSLVREVERRATERGFSKIGLAVNPDLNADAMRLYERLGYRRTGGEKYLDGVYDGNEDWVIDMEKRIEPGTPWP